MSPIEAIYEDGVFKPLAPVELPEQCKVEVRIAGAEQPPAASNPAGEGMDKLYALLDQRFQSGHRDTAERHNEHEP